MKSFKKVVSILLVISIIASIFAVSASAVYGTVPETAQNSGWNSHKVGNNQMLYQFEKTADLGENFLNTILPEAKKEADTVLEFLGNLFKNQSYAEMNASINNFFYLNSAGTLNQHYSFYNIGLDRFGYEALPTVWCFCSRYGDLSMGCN